MIEIPQVVDVDEARHKVAGQFRRTMGAKVGRKECPGSGARWEVRIEDSAIGGLKSGGEGGAGTWEFICG